MSEEDKKVVADQTGNEDKTKENNSGDNNELDPKTLLAQKLHFREKSEKLENELAELKGKLEKLTKNESKDEKTNDTPDNKNMLEEKVNLIEFSIKHSDLPSSIIEEVYKIAKAENIKPDEALEKPYMKLYIEDVKRKARVDNASNTSSRSSVSSGKPISEMTREEHQKMYQEFISSQTNK